MELKNHYYADYNNKHKKKLSSLYSQTRILNTQIVIQLGWLLFLDLDIQR